MSLADREVWAELPGPQHNRRRSPYMARLDSQAASQDAPGCVLLWHVYGGREVYQVALERLRNGLGRWHCTCADSVYRGEDRVDHRCKHVRAVMRIGRGFYKPPAPVDPDD